MTTHEQFATTVTLPSDLEIRVTRAFAAPRTLVWQMWTQAEHLVKWWGPKGWTLPVCDVDLREGGSWLYCMKGPDGMESWGKAVYREIVEPERLMYTDYFVDANGEPLPDMPEATSTYVFSEQNGITTVVNTTRYATKELRDTVIEMGVEEGIKQTLDRLADALAQAQSV